MLKDLIKDLSNEILEVKKELTALRRINSYTSLTYGEWLTQWLELYKKPNIKKSPFSLENELFFNAWWR